MSGQRPIRPRDFDPAELGTTDPADLADALQSARQLDASIEDLPAMPGAQFTNRVMAALVNEPTPAAVGFLAPLHRLGLIAGFGASVRQAWASIGAPGRPTFARAAALAYVLVVAIAGTSLAGAATLGFAGALGILGPTTTQPSPSTMPGPSMAPEQSEQPSGVSEPPEGSESPSDGPDASDDHGGSGGPEPSDDNGGNSGPGSTSSGGGSDDGSTLGGGSATSSPDGGGGSDDHGGATQTPKPSQTPRPTGTPKPTQTSGSGSGSSD